MVQIKAAFLERELMRGVRPDARNFLRPDWRRDIQPRSDLHSVFELYERKYRLDQTRVPAGSRDGGQWTDEGGRAEGSERPLVIIAGFPKIPRQKPPNSADRTAIAKAAAIALAEAGAQASGLVEEIKKASWLYDAWSSIISYLDGPKTLSELQENATSARPGYDRHHIVERSSALEVGYPSRRIDAPENIVSIPRMKHWEINAWYQKRNLDFGDVAPREYLTGKDWDERERVGFDALRKFGVLKP